MLVLTKSENLCGFYTSNDIGGLPEREIPYISSRLDTFKLFMNSLRTLLPDSASNISNVMVNTYQLPFNVEIVSQWHSLFSKSCYCLELLKVVFFDALARRANIKTFIEPKTINIVNHMFHETEMYDEVVTLVNDFITFCSGGDDTFNIYMPKDADSAIADKEKLHGMGNIMWMRECLHSTVEGDYLHEIFYSLPPDKCIVLAGYKDLQVYNYEGSQNFMKCQFRYRSDRDHNKTKSYKSYLMMDEMTFFKIRHHGEQGFGEHSTLVMHDDITPYVTFADTAFDDSDKPTDRCTLIDDLVVGKTYFMLCRFRNLRKNDSMLKPVTITFKPVSGCAFKENEAHIPLGKIPCFVNQIKITSNNFRMKISTKEKILPFKFFAPSKRLSAEGLAWL